MVPQNTTPDTSPKKEPAHRLNLSLERAQVAQSWLAANAEKMAHVTHSARVMAAVGLLICDDAGRIANAALDSAMDDPDAVFYAELLVAGVFK